MAIFSQRERKTAEAIADIAFGNPFDEVRLARERKVLGADFVKAGAYRYRPDAGYDAMFPNVPALHRRAEKFIHDARERLRSDHDATEEDLRLYEELVCYMLYNRHMSVFREPIRRSLKSRDWGGPVKTWPKFLEEFRAYLEIPGRTLPSQLRPEHLFEVCFQVARAFHAIFEYIVGGSTATARLREAVWQSIFTHDMRRYMRTLYRRMAHVTTLITGPSGTGKELVAQAIGWSRYLEFDAVKKRFAGSSYTSLNLSAFAPTLIESELFGHVEAAFNGANERKGWLELCSGPADTVFLDEIGEVDEAIQVKLLRVLQERRFVRVGETTDDPSKFRGKIIAATNRDLAAAMRSGKFREDFFHRLCDDHIVTPSLADQLADRPQDLTEMVRFLASRMLDEPTQGPNGHADAETRVGDADALTGEAIDWIEKNLKDHPWPGNFRELSRCVRNVMIRGSYRPPMSPRADAGVLGPIEGLLHNVCNVELTDDRLRGRYYALAYFRSDESWAEAGRRLGVDYRTVQDRHDPAFLEELRRARAEEERRASHRFGRPSAD